MTQRKFDTKDNTFYIQLPHKLNMKMILKPILRTRERKDQITIVFRILGSLSLKSGYTKNSLTKVPIMTTNNYSVRKREKCREKHIRCACAVSEIRKLDRDVVVQCHEM